MSCSFWYVQEEEAAARRFACCPAACERAGRRRISATFRDAVVLSSLSCVADRCDASIGNRRKGERNHPCASTSVGKRIEERQERLGISIASVIVRKRKERQW